MSSIAGTVIAAKITTGDTANTFPTADANDILGGHHTVGLIADRDAIPAERRSEGMTCYVVETGIIYKLKGGITNASWLALIPADTGSKPDFSSVSAPSLYDIAAKYNKSWTVFSGGTFTADGVISSTFCGWASAFTHGGSFNGAIVSLTVETQTEVICRIRSSSDFNTVISESRRVLTAGAGQYVFRFPVTITSALSGAVFYLSVESANATVRVMRCSATASGANANAGTYQEKYVLTGAAENAWVAAAPAGSYPLVVSFVLGDTGTHHPYDTAESVTQLNGSLSVLSSRTSGYTVSGLTSPFCGYGNMMNRPGSPFTFNAVRLPYVWQSSAVITGEAVIVEVRDTNSAGTLLAWGFSRLDPSVISGNTDIILLNPTTLAPISISTASLSSTYFVGYVIIGGKKTAEASDTKATITGFAGTSYYASNAVFPPVWIHYSGDPCHAIEVCYVGTASYQYLARAVVASSATSATTDTMKINMPLNWYAVVGHQINLYSDNICAGRAASEFSWAYTWGNYPDTDVITLDNGFRFTPVTARSTNLTIMARKLASETALDTKTITVKAAATAAGTGVTRKCLFMGDSTTASGVTTGEIVTLFSTDAMAVTLIGTQGSGSNKHEGYGGKTINWFYTDAASPMVFAGAFNFATYLSTNGFTMAANDWVCIHLGINDIFSFTTDAAVNTQTTTMLTQLTGIVANIKSAVSGIRIALAVTIPPAYSQDAFGASYYGGQCRDRYRRNLGLWHQVLLSNAWGTNVYVVPLHASIDTVNNFPVGTAEAVNSRNTATVVRQNNGVHPANSGYYQMADVWHAFLKCQEA